MFTKDQFLRPTDQQFKIFDSVLGINSEHKDYF